jgi:hypothetical protein
VEIPTLNNDKSSACYKTFHLYNDINNTLTIKLSPEFNLVGLTTWEGILLALDDCYNGIDLPSAGMFLGEYVLANEEQFRGKKVLELGAGVGTTSIILGRVKGIDKLITTDYAPEILQNLTHNLEISKILNSVDF